MKKLISITTFLFFVSPTIFANTIDAQSAYGSALEFVAMKFLYASVIFYLLTYGLINKPKDTAAKNGRWVASILALMSFISYSLHNDNQARNLVESGIATVVWFAIGFIAGFLWFKFKQIKGSNTDNFNIKTYVNKKIFLPILAIISIGIIFWFFGYNGIGKAAIYDVYPSCKSVDADCSEVVANVRFKVDKEKSQVIRIHKALHDGSDGMVKLENCFVVDEHNWKCEDYRTKYSSGKTTVMIEDKVTEEDVTFYGFSGLEEKTYHGYTYVKR